MGPFWGTRAMEIVKKTGSSGLLWKRIKLTTTRKANAKKRLHRLWQNWNTSFVLQNTWKLHSLSLIDSMELNSTDEGLQKIHCTVDGIRNIRMRQC
ncbi:hypothetical protein QJS04_geneDACA015417 [Acorus gramineus]|uniref:Uncharacterized protein n=1 Tax=Acorus gramineus TaxID=55184 RepID=A0AAV9A661_ACOGR|nr:hypothetical protein QJS04_geneDACA015417 [Acorus gramineus]